MKSQNRNKAIKRKLEIDEKLEAKVAAINEIQKKVRKLSNEMDDKFEAKVETINNEIDEKIRELSNEIDEKLEQIESSTEKIIGNINEKLGAMSASSDSDNKDDETESGDEKRK